MSVSKFQRIYYYLKFVKYINRNNNKNNVFKKEKCHSLIWLVLSNTYIKAMAMCAGQFSILFLGQFSILFFGQFSILFFGQFSILFFSDSFLSYFWIEFYLFFGQFRKNCKKSKKGQNSIQKQDRKLSEKNKIENYPKKGIENYPKNRIENYPKKRIENYPSHMARAVVIGVN